MERERVRLVRLQERNTMPLIGGLLDAWDSLPNDIKGDPELTMVAKYINMIYIAMDPNP